MNRFKKTLLLCAIAVFVIATVFTLSACDKTPKVESISVEINGGAEKVVLTQQNASVENIGGKITVVVHYNDDTTESITDFIVEDFDSSKLDTDQTVTVKYGDFSATVVVRVTGTVAEPQIVSIAVKTDGEKLVLKQSEATEAAILSKITVTATLDDSTTKPVTAGLTLQGFDATKLDTDQTVTVKYGKLSATVVVRVESKAVEPKIVSIAVSFDGDKLVLQQSEATEAAILSKITVTATFDDSTTKPIAAGLTLQGFDASKLDTDQSVTVKLGEIVSDAFTVVVESTPDDVEITDISLTFSGEKVTLQKADASEQALRALLTVSALKSDDSSEEISDYQVLELDLAKVNEDQTVTIKYGEFSKTVTVVIEDNSEPTPDTYKVYVIVNGDAEHKIELTLNPSPSDPSEKFLKEFMGDATLAEGDTVVIKDSDEHEFVNYQTESPFKGTATKDGAHNFYVKIYTDGDSVYVAAPAGGDDPTPPDPVPYKVYVIVNGDEAHKTELVLNPNASDPSGNLESEYHGTVTLAVGDTVVVKDSENKTFTYYKDDCAFQGTAEKVGVHTFYVQLWNDGGDSIWVTVPTGDLPTPPDPETEHVYVVVNGDEEHRIELTLNPEPSDPSEKFLKEFMGDVTLAVGDIVVIKDSENNAFVYYQTESPFKGTATKAGVHNFYVKIYTDGHSIYVAAPTGGDDPTPPDPDVPQEGVYIVINDGDPIELTQENPQKPGEKMLVGKTLAVGDTVVIYRDGVVLEPQNGCSFNGTVYLNGDYDFYVSDKIWVNYWMLAFVERNATVQSLGLEQYETDLDTAKFSTQYKLVTDLLAGDKITIKDIGGTVFSAYENENVFNGTASKNGTYTLYVKVGKNSADNVVYTGYAAPTVKSLSTNVSAQPLVLYGVQANDLKAAIVVTATMSDNSQLIVTDYSIAGYDKTKLNEVQTVTVSFGGKTVQITVKVLAAQVAAITAAFEGDKIELIGVKATVQNILKAITVTATYNDGTSAEVQGSVKDGTFDATNYTSVQQVVICYGEKETTVPVVAIEASMSKLVVTPNETISVTGGDSVKVAESIRSKITSVSILKTDDTLLEDVSYNVGIPTGFDYQNFTTPQTVSITSGSMKTTIQVQLLKEISSVSVNNTAFALPESSAGENERLAALRAKLTVTVTYTDGDSITVSDYKVHFGTFSSSVYAAQNVTVSFGEWEQVIAITVVAVPKISVNDGEAAFMSADPANVGKYLSGNVELAVGDTVAISYAGSAVALGDSFNGTATLSGTYTFAVTVSGQTATAVVTVPQYQITLKVMRNDAVAETRVLVEKTDTDKSDGRLGEYYVQGLALQAGDVLAISDNAGHSAISNYEGCDFNGTAVVGGSYDVYVKTYSNSVFKIHVDIPLYLTTSGGSAVALALNEHADEETNKVAEYLCSVVLAKDETVTFHGLARDAYYDRACKFEGTATRSGLHYFYVKLYADKGNTIWVEANVTISVNGGAPQKLVRQTSNESHEEYKIEGLMLNDGDTVEIMVEGETAARTNYKSGCNFEGAATEQGYHDFYVCIDGSIEDGIWVTTAYRKVYFYNQGWEDNWSRVKAHCFISGTDINNGGWPGVEMTKVEDKWFMLKVDVKFNGVIFVGLNATTGEMNGNRTPEGEDLTIDTTLFDLYMVYNNATTTQRPTAA